jgi:hypothetical protein
MRGPAAALSGYSYGRPTAAYWPGRMDPHRQSTDSLLLAPTLLRRVKTIPEKVPRRTPIEFFPCSPAAWPTICAVCRLPNLPSRLPNHPSNRLVGASQPADLRVLTDVATPGAVRDATKPNRHFRPRLPSRAGGNIPVLPRNLSSSGVLKFL